MPIKASSAREIDRLLTDLKDGGEVRREAAIARLSVLGSRAVERLVDLVQSDAAGDARRSAIRALEAIGDHRGLSSMLRAIDDSDVAVARAAVAAARVFLDGAYGTEALDRLTAVALDRSRAEALRLTAFEALGGLEPSTLKPLRQALAADPHPAIRGAISVDPRTSTGGAPTTSSAVLEAAAKGRLPDPGVLRHALAEAGGGVPLTVIQRIIEAVRDREALEAPPNRLEWMWARGAAHLILARRDSRLALYDLRESLLAAAAPLPVEFLAALALIGDRSCLEPLAAAHARGLEGARKDWWREHLAETFRVILRRERLTRRHAVVKQIEARWPRAFEELAHESAAAGRRTRQ